LTGSLPPTASVLRSYRSSRYSAGPVTVRIGRRPAGLPRSWRDLDLALLSAANPGGRRRPDGWNERMMARLSETMRRIPHCRGEGRLGRWSEPLLLAAIGPRRAAVLARRFRQNAIVRVRAGRDAVLVLL
jgi:hypothetical protein